MEDCREMKAANVHEIFDSVDSSEKTTEDDDFWKRATFGVPVEAAAESSELDAFDADEQPVQKTRKEVHDEGIDRTPMMSVAEIRMKFSKSTAPLFPKHLFGASSKHGGGRSPGAASSATLSPREEGEAHPPMSLDEAEPQLVIRDSDTVMLPRHDDAVPTRPSQPVDKRPSGPSSPGGDPVTFKEFMDMAKLHGCEEGIRRFSQPTTVEIVIKPEHTSNVQAKGGLLVKKMMLQFNPEQRLLVMLRQGTVRYIRLNDVVKIDGGENCLDFLGSLSNKVPSSVTRGVPMALYFTTTRNPMVIMLSTVEEKEALFRLVIFLRQLLRTSSPLQVVA